MEGVWIKVEALEKLKQQRDEYKMDAERLLYLEKMLFESKWNGVLGNGGARNWNIHGSYRHTMQNFVGQTFREVIDAAIAKVKP